VSKGREEAPRVGEAVGGTFPDIFNLRDPKRSFSSASTRARKERRVTGSGEDGDEVLGEGAAP